MLASQVSSASTSALLAFFNANTGGNQVAKFRDRQTAERRVLALIAEMAAEESGDQAAAKEACKRGDEALTTEFASPDMQAVAANVADPAADVVIKLKIADKPLDRDSTKPWQRAKVIISDLLAGGTTARKDLIAACVAAGIKYNTADGAHYEMCVKGRAKS